MRLFFVQGTKVKIYRGSTNSTRAQEFKKNARIDICELNRILKVDKEGLYAVVEPNVPMDRLVRETLREGLLPQVVPEFPGITVGGAVQGGAGESSSFKYGLVHETCVEYEIILADGSLVYASNEQNTDLFEGVACSYGTLGVVTAIKIRLLHTQPFVRLSYIPVTSAEESIRVVADVTARGADFVDGILFTKERGVVMSGVLSNKVDLPIVRFSRSWDEWFYIHADTISKRGGVVYEELVPIEDYLFRYDRGAFWMGMYAFRLVHVPFNRVTRFLFDFACHTRELYQSLHNAGISQRYLIQDVALPKKSAASFLSYAGENLGVYPLWFIPLKSGTARLSLNHLPAPLIISVGVWGYVGSEYERFVTINQDFEKKISDLGGRKWLYAHQFYTREQFWSIYDDKWYSALREKFRAEKTFPDVYEKTRVFKRYTPSVLRGMLRNLVGSLTPQKPQGM